MSSYLNSFFRKTPKPQTMPLAGSHVEDAISESIAPQEAVAPVPSGSASDEADIYVREEVDDNPDLELSERVNAIAERRMSAELQMTRRSLEKHKAKFSEIRDSFRSTSTMTENASAYIANLQDMLRDAEKGLDRQVRVEAENSILKADLTSLRSQLAKMKESLDAQNAMVDSLRSRSVETREALQQAHVDISQHLTKIRESDQENEALNESLKDALAELKSSQNTCLNLDGEVSMLLEANQSYQEQIAAHERRITEYEKEVDEWKRSREFEVTRREALQRELEDTSSRLTETNRDRIDLESRVEVLMTDIEAQARHFKEQLRNREDRIYSLESSVEGLTSKIKVNVQTIDHLKSENAELTKIISENDKRLSSAKRRNEEIKRQHNEDREKLFSAVNRISELDVRVTSLVASLDATRKENQSYADVLEKLHEENRQLRESQIKYSGLPDEPVISSSTAKKRHKNDETDGSDGDDKKVISISSKKRA